MAIYVYNTKQQALNSKKIAELFSFTSNDFAGLISNLQFPIVAGENSWSWAPSLINTQAALMGGGVDIAYDVDDTVYAFNYECSIWGLEIGVPDPNANIATNTYGKAVITEIPCTSIGRDNLYFIINFPSGNPSEKAYYEFTENGYVLSEDTEVQEGKVYYFMLENEVFKVSGATFAELEQAKSFDYYGNTVWITSERFFIPFCGIYNGEIIPMLFNRDKSGYESFLTARTYYNLLMELGNQFVWRVGGPTLGDVGDLNITDNYITNKENAEDGVKVDRPTITNTTATTNLPLADKLLYVDENGKIYRSNDNYIVTINHGGTGGNREDMARKGLGFTYGTEDPSAEPKKRVDGTTDIGAVYFKLL